MYIMSTYLVQLSVHYYHKVQGTRYGMFVFEPLNGNYMCTNGSLMTRKKRRVLFWMKEVVWYTFIIAIVTTLDKGSLCVCVCV